MRRSTRERKTVERFGYAKTAYFEPNTYNQAVSCIDSDKWQQAMFEEHQSIIDAKVWEVHEKQDLPPRRKLVGSRWVYKVKFNADSSVERYKARLVAQGFS